MRKVTEKMWYVLRVASGTEDFCCAMLSKDHTVMTPMMFHTRTNRKMRTVHRVLAPMFSGYVFILLRSPADLVYRPTQSYGFLRHDGGSMVAMSHEEIDDMVALEDAMTAVIPPRATPRKGFFVGEKLTLKNTFGELILVVLEVLKNSVVLSAPVPSGRLKVSKSTFGALESV